MNRPFVCLALFVALGDAELLAQFPGPRRDQDAARYGWLSSLTEARDQARKTGKPLMAVVRCVP